MRHVGVLFDWLINTDEDIYSFTTAGFACKNDTRCVLSIMPDRLSERKNGTTF